MSEIPHGEDNSFETSFMRPNRDLFPDKDDFMPAEGIEPRPRDMAEFDRKIAEIESNWSEKLSPFTLAQDTAPEAQSIKKVLEILTNGSAGATVDASFAEMILNSNPDKVTIQSEGDGDQSMTRVLFESTEELPAMEGITRGMTKSRLDADNIPEPVFVYVLPEVPTSQI
jgi:hypothetical protein